MRTLALALTATLLACSADQAVTTEAELDHGDPNPMLYRKDAHPFGKSITRWSELLWSYIYAQPFDTNPFFSTTGDTCGDGQRGPVWFLPSVPGSALGTDIERSCTLPRGKAIIQQLSSILNDYPCPDPTFHPAPGQSLYDFLIEAILPIFDSYSGLDVFLDGVAIVDPLDYRFTSDDVFHFTGDPSMAEFDSCVTGTRQAGVIDGFYLMFKPLAPGQHTIVIVGHDMEGTPVTLTEHLTVR